MQFKLLLKRTKEKKIIQQLQTTLKTLHLLLVYQLLQPQSCRPLGQTAAPNMQYPHALFGVLVIAALIPQVLDGFQGLCSFVISLCFWKWEQQVQLSFRVLCPLYLQIVCEKGWWGGSFLLALLCAQIFCIRTPSSCGQICITSFFYSKHRDQKFKLVFSGWCVFWCLS